MALKEEINVYNIAKVFQEVLYFLPSKFKKQFWCILSGMVFLAGFETITLGAIALYISTIADPKSILKSTYIAKINGVFNTEVLAHSNQMIVYFSIFIICLVAIKNILKSVIVYFSSLYSSIPSQILGEQLLTGFMYLPYEWHLSQNSSNLSLAVLWRIHFSRLINSGLFALSDIILIIIFLTTLIIIEPLVSFIIIIAIGLLAFIIYRYIRKFLDKTTSQTKKFQKNINRDISTAIQAIKDVKIFIKERSIIFNFNRQTTIETLLWANQQFITQCPSLILETMVFLLLGLTIATIYVYANLPSNQLIPILALLAVTAWRVLPAINKIIAQISVARTSIPFVLTGLKYLQKINKLSLSALPLRDTKETIKFNHTIKFENVSFIYKGAQSEALQNFNALISKGKTVGVIGRSGAGKSTLADLLIGLIEPSSGRIMIDGVLLDSDYMTSWMANIGYVAQSAYIFDGTILANIAFGCKETNVDLSRIHKCCKMAAMDEFISKLPEGINTSIGERGVKLSGGQQQRLSIARALYNAPEIMLFDEATSSLDYKSEKEIRDTIYGLRGELTLVIIAHRLSTVEGCDEIIWLEDGRIRKTGTPDGILPEYRRVMAEEEIESDTICA